MLHTDIRRDCIAKTQIVYNLWLSKLKGQENIFKRNILDQSIMHFRFFVICVKGAGELGVYNICFSFYNFIQITRYKLYLTATGIIKFKIDSCMPKLSLRAIFFGLIALCTNLIILGKNKSHYLMKILNNKKKLNFNF